MRKVIALLLFLTACTSPQKESIEQIILTSNESAEVLGTIENYIKNHPYPASKSSSTGTVGKGKLSNGWLIPFTGNNFNYFSQKSYLNGRAFLHQNIHSSTLNTYTRLEKENPNQNYVIMECSNEKGGTIYPHRTHQNGLSIDFMSPLIKNGMPCYEYDQLDDKHYLMQFDVNGNYLKEKEVAINFEAIAQHILILEEESRKQKYKISKVIFNTHLKKHLFSGFYGKKLQSSNIYFARYLKPFINNLHDDHYHVDFERI